MNSLHKQLTGIAAAALLAFAGTAGAQIRSGTTGIDNSGSTASEVAHCRAGQTQQDYETCMKEARNAAADKRRGAVEAGDRDEFRANRLKRCEVFTNTEDKAACVARVLGTGNAEGSVAGGGVLRQSSVTTVHGAEGASTKSSDTAVLVDRETQRSAVVVVEKPEQKPEQK